MNTKWIEDLPTKCPPESAVPSEKTFYRLVETIPPSMKDFWSNWKLTPKRSFKVSECIAKACSIFDNPKDCTRQKKYTCHKHKKVIEIKMNPNHGVLENTGKNSHYSWWITGSLKIDQLVFEEVHDQA